MTSVSDKNFQNSNAHLTLKYLVFSTFWVFRYKWPKCRIYGGKTVRLWPLFRAVSLKHRKRPKNTAFWPYDPQKHRKIRSMYIVFRLFAPWSPENTEKYGLCKTDFRLFAPWPLKTPKNKVHVNPTFNFSHPDPLKTPKNKVHVNSTFNFSHPDPRKHRKIGPYKSS